jgi:hypothetical protein
MLRRTVCFLLLGFVASLALVGAQGSARGDSATATYQYLIGVSGLETPDIARASNGDTISITGSGYLSVHPKSVNGGGNFTTSSGQAGTWVALDLLSFVSYGPVTQAAQGGEALIRIRLSSGADAILTIECLVGNPPPGKEEGIRVAVQGGPNFNEPVSGQNLFIQQ